MSTKRSNRGRAKKQLTSSSQPQSLAIASSAQPQSVAIILPPAAPTFAIKKNPNKANKVLRNEYLSENEKNLSLLDIMERDIKSLHNETFEAGTVSDPLLISMMVKPNDWRVAFNGDAFLKKKRSDFELPEHGSTILVMVLNILPVVITVNQFGGNRAYLLTAATVNQHEEFFDREIMAFDADAVYNYLNDSECDWDNDFVVVDAKGNTSIFANVLAHFCFVWKMMKGKPLPHPEIIVPTSALAAVRLQVFTEIKEILLLGLSSLKNLSPICYGSIASLMVEEPSQKRTKQDANTVVLDCSILVKNKVVIRCKKLLATVDARLEYLRSSSLRSFVKTSLPAPFAAASPALYAAASPALYAAASPALYAAASPSPYAATLYAAASPALYAAELPPVAAVTQFNSFENDATCEFLQDQVSTLLPGTVTVPFPMFDFTS